MSPVTPAAAATGTMTAIVQDKYGTAPEEVLQLGETARPAIADDEILVRVRAASVDRGTWHLMAGLAYPMRLAGFGLRKPKATNPGRSMAGTVESASTNMTQFQPGDDSPQEQEPAARPGAASRGLTPSRPGMTPPSRQFAGAGNAATAAGQACRRQGERDEGDRPRQVRFT